MPLTNTQEVYEIRAISPQVINPSITEGRFLNDSTLGPNRAVSIVKYIPVFLTNPSLTGDPGIPSTLFCSTGSVDASPAGYRHYQWYIDGVPSISGDGPAFAYFTTNILMDAKEITCQVTAINLLGSSSAMSNGIVVSVVEPVIVGEYYELAVTGMSAQDQVTVFQDQIAVLTGMWVDDFVTTFQDHIFAVTGTSMEDNIFLPSYDMYGVQFYALLDDIVFSNPGAESGSVSGWTVTAGALRSVASSTPSGGGSYVFMGSSSNNVDTTFSRAVTFSSGFNSKVDLGTTILSLTFFANQEGTGYFGDQMSAVLSFLDGSGTLISTIHDFNPFEPVPKTYNGSTNTWQRCNTAPVYVPSGTRSIKIEFWIGGRPRTGGSHCQIDMISLQLYEPI